MKSLLPLTVVLVGAVACGARTQLEVDERTDADSDSDAGRDSGGPFPFPDTGPLDTGVDADRRDADEPRDAGEACRRDRDCAVGRCRLDEAVRPVDLDPAPLMCGDDSPAGEDGAFCDDAGGCARGLCVVAGTCVAPCVDDGDCGEGQWCRELWVRTDVAALQGLRGCVNRFDVHPNVSVTRESLGSLRGPVVDVAIPAIRQPTLFIYENPGEEPMTVERLVDERDGSVLFDIFDIGPGLPAPINPVAPFSNPLNVLIPISPRAPISPRGYAMRLDLMRARADVDVAMMQRTGRPGRVLDIDIFYLGGGGFAPRGGRVPPALLEAFETMVALFGLRLGDIRHHEVVGGVRERLAIVETEPPDELEELFALTAGLGRPALSVFLPRELESALGISGGIPGAWGANGRKQAGIALSADLFDVLGASLPSVFSHEAGHYFGLFHTTEIEGTVIEPLPGTASCPLSADDGDGVLFEDECLAFDGQNLMFWGGFGMDLHPQQRAVVRQSFLLR